MQKRFVCSAKALKIKEFGDLFQSIDLVHESLPSVLCQNEVHLRFIASPINYMDIAIVRDLCSQSIPLPFVCGSEGVAQVVQVGQNVSKVKVNDFVVPAAYNMGTWRSEGVFREDQCIVVPNTLSWLEASVLSVNPCIAYRILKDCASLNSRDIIIQEGCTSSVGLYVMQLAKLWNIKTVNVIGDSEKDDLKETLYSYGADVVLTYSELKTQKAAFVDRGSIKLAITCSAGPATMSLFRYLDEDSCLLVYGDENNAKVRLPVGQLIFRNIKLCGFSMANWMRKATYKAKCHMFQEVGNLFASSMLKITPYKLYKIDEWANALQSSLIQRDVKSGIQERIILEF